MVDKDADQADPPVVDELVVFIRRPTIGPRRFGLRTELSSPTGVGAERAVSLASIIPMPIDTNPATLIMTATVAPSRSMPSTSLFDPERRLREYAEAFEHYLRVDPRRLGAIVFAENSGYDLDPLRRLADAIDHGKRVEFVGFVSPCSPGRGKGYSELHMLDHVRESSRIIGDGAPLWKVTGRLRVANVGRLIATAPTRYDVYCDLRRVPLIGNRLGGDRWMDTRLFSCSVEGYDRYFRGQYRSLSSSVVENHFFGLLDAARRHDRAIVPRFRIQPELIGTSGHSGKDYQNLEYQLKTGVRRVTRAISPWLWV